MRTLLQDLLDYVSVPTCRQLAILDYFSDEAERALGPCGLCDRCATTVQPQVGLVGDEAVCAKAVLAAVAWCLGRFGVNRIVEILRGSRSKALLAYGAEGCPGYGLYQAWSKTAMIRLVKTLIEAGYLHVEGLEYPTLDLTRRGREVLEGAGLPVLGPAKGPAPATFSAMASEQRGSSPTLQTASIDPQLFERLRQLRRELAEEEGVAPFVIFHDKTLRTIAGHKPVTLAGLLEIPGIGEVKIERYGRRVLGVLNQE
jgi:ATP-dependent DNA helicase RecQ